MKQVSLKIKYMKKKIEVEREIDPYRMLFKNEVEDVKIPKCSLPYKLNNYEKNREIVIVEKNDDYWKKRMVFKSKITNGYSWDECTLVEQIDIVGNSLIDLLSIYRIHNWLDDRFYRLIIEELYQKEEFKTIPVYLLLVLVGLESEFFVH